MAQTKPELRSVTKTTLPNVPFPSSFIILKCSKHTDFPGWVLFCFLFVRKEGLDNSHCSKLDEVFRIFSLAAGDVGDIGDAGDVGVSGEFGSTCSS